MLKTNNLKLHDISVLHYCNIEWAMVKNRKYGAKCSRALEQFIRRSKEFILNKLTEKLQDPCKYILTVSTSTISRHLNHLEYENCLPINSHTVK